jgi:hypothetical protein
MTFNEIQEFAKQNLPWDEIIWSIFIASISFLIKIPQAIYMAHKVLKKNRASLGNGSGGRQADIFIHSWHRKMDYEKKIEQNDILINSDGKTCRILTAGRMAEYSLKKLGLVRIIEEKGMKKVQAIKNLRNRIVFYLIISWLILFCGDRISYYRNLKTFESTD